MQFSTNEDPRKSKTKCVAFLKKPRELKPIKLNGNNLPWINSPEKVVHLGTILTNSNDILESDILQKRAKYIQRNNEILQEFHFANPETKVTLNNIYNMSLYSSPLWNLFSKPVETLENTYNRSIRMMLNLPLQTHRYLIEPLSQQPHMRFILYKRFIAFRHKILNGSKDILKHVLNICENNCGSVTGSNLRKLMLLCDKNSISNLNSSDIDFLCYQPVPDIELWRLDLIEELLETRHGNSNIEGFTPKEISEMIDYLCIS